MLRSVPLKRLAWCESVYHSDMEISRGLPEDLRPAAAKLFWAGFGPKLSRPLMGDSEKGQRFVAHMMDPDAMLIAVEDNALLGVLMMVDQDHPTKTHEWRGAREVYGLVGGAARRGWPW